MSSHGSVLVYRVDWKRIEHKNWATDISTSDGWGFGSAREAEIPEKQQVPDEVQQVTTVNIDLNVAVYNEPAAGNAREMEISEGQQVLVKDDSQMVCGD